MKSTKQIFALLSLLLLLPVGTLTAKRAATGGVRTENVKAKAAAGLLVVQWRMVMDSLQMRSNQTLVFTPVIEDGKGNTEVMRSVMVNGRNQHLVYLRNGSKNYPDAIEIQRKNHTSQAYDYCETTDCQPWMTNATVRINVDTCGCGNLTGKSAGKPAEINPHWENKCFTAFAQPQVAADDPVLSLQGKAYLDFPVNRTELHPDYHNNPSELHKIMQTIDTVRNNANVEITSISIHGYASPEGSYQNNERLAQGRAATLKNYVMRQYDLPASIYHVSATPEDWAGLDSFVVKSNLDEKEQILSVIRSDMEPDAKDQQLKKQFPEAYRTMLNAYYPYLRHSDYEVQYKIRPMSDKDAARLIDTNPKLLSLTKMYRIASLYPAGSEEYNHVIETAANTYPDNAAANINAANAALRKGDTVTAKQFLKHCGQEPQALNARGVTALIEGNETEAVEFFNQAKAAGCTEAQQNLLLLQEH